MNMSDHSDDITHDEDVSFDQEQDMEEHQIENDRKGDEPNRVSQVNANEDDIKQTPAAPVLVPSLRGKYELVGNTLMCKGLWAMSDAGHAFPDQTSPFEFKLSKSFDSSSTLPINGKYQGWFFLKQPPPFKGLKIDDKDMIIKFFKNEDGDGYRVEGRGVNRFGSFNLYGSLSDDNHMQLYREYIPKNTPGAKSKAVSAEHKVKPAPSAADIASEIHREGSGRVRKVSAFMKEYEDSLAPRPVKPPSSVPKPASSANLQQQQYSNNLASYPISSASMNLSNANTGRSQRLPTAILKCGELLKEMMKQPQAVWFLEPVDHIKLNIPDYVTIIAKPMDFGTISQNIEANIYETPEQFAEHMRLIFRNAITYNQMRDHPVHIAARELNAKFEDKFRSLMANLSALMAGPVAGPYYAEPKISRTTSSSSTKSKSKSSSSRPSWSKGRPSSVGSSGRFDAFMPPVMDAGSASLMEMQRKMHEMQEELVSLRTTIRQTEVKSSLETQRSAAQNPLTFEEKRNLIAQINRLPGDKMDHVVEIIQAAIKPSQRGENNDEIEIPLDELDTLTLRKLQRYVEDCNRPKKRPSAPMPTSHRSSGSAPKKARPDYPNHQHIDASASLYGHSEVYADPHAQQAHSFAMDEDELLFDANILEEDGIHASQESPMKPTSSNQPAAIKRDDGGITIHPQPTSLSLSNPIDIMDHNNPITIMNASAWSNTNTPYDNIASSSAATSITTASDSSWTAMAAELKAKEEREQHRRDEQERLTQARAKQEADRIENIRRQSEILEQQKRLESDHETLMKRMTEERAARELLQHKEEERRRREEEAAAAAALVSHDIHNSMMYFDDDEDEEQE